MVLVYSLIALKPHSSETAVHSSLQRWQKQAPDQEEWLGEPEHLGALHTLCCG